MIYHVSITRSCFVLRINAIFLLICNRLFHPCASSAALRVEEEKKRVTRKPLRSLQLVSVTCVVLFFATLRSCVWRFGEQSVHTLQQAARNTAYSGDSTLHVHAHKLHFPFVCLATDLTLLDSHNGRAYLA
jgi:hypothetical protein